MKRTDEQVRSAARTYWAIGLVLYGYLSYQGYRTLGDNSALLLLTPLAGASAGAIIGWRKGGQSLALLHAAVWLLITTAGVWALAVTAFLVVLST
ncbi:hypothetical protein [Paractinoplanes lichenicola]|uniref:Uncharacterized protein n=1 Tax=Paractinoplanes lichenicola TaxID=2802976 RepID=A0ABS1VWI5_9ACTN|nr:hypothetical protein [Actinoplanes lichenicola]MBL7258841.1 hypothetical protein [Actinoplanes lichenicola]